MFPAHNVSTCSYTSCCVGSRDPSVRISISGSTVLEDKPESSLFAQAGQRMMELKTLNTFACCFSSWLRLVWRKAQWPCMCAGPLGLLLLRQDHFFIWSFLHFWSLCFQGPAPWFPGDWHTTRLAPAPWLPQGSWISSPVAALKARSCEVPRFSWSLLNARESDPGDIEDPGPGVRR